MDENERIRRNAVALFYLGKAYVKIPRVILERLFSKIKSERMIGKIYCTLFVCCNYADGCICVGGQTLFCRAGEWIATYDELAQLSEISARSLDRYIKMLVKESLVDVERVADRTRFRVCGYEQFVGVDDLPDKPKEKKQTSKKTEKQPDAAILAERLAREEEMISRGHKPRIDLLNQL